MRDEKFKPNDEFVKIPHIKITLLKNLQEKLENSLKTYLERHNLS